MSHATHRVTLLPDGVEISDREPTNKAHWLDYDIVSPSSIPGIRVRVVIDEDTEFITAKIPSEVLDKIPILQNFHKYAMTRDDDESFDQTGKHYSPSYRARDAL